MSIIKNPADKPSVFTKVSLYTESNNFVTELYIPPFVMLPKVILWGVRHFVQSHVVPTHYQECFGYTVPENWNEIIKGKI